MVAGDEGAPPAGFEGLFPIFVLDLEAANGWLRKLDPSAAAMVVSKLASNH